MAKLLGNDLPGPPAREGSYPAEWFDGAWRLLTRDEDFPGRNVESAARKFRKEAQNRGLRGQAVIVSVDSFRARAGGRR
jgi:hypothetical protein